MCDIIVIVYVCIVCVCIGCVCDIIVIDVSFIRHSVEDAKAGEEEGSGV